MKSRNLRCLVALPLLLPFAVFSCSQPAAECVVGHAGSGLGYGTTLSIKGDMPACAGTVQHPTGVLLKDLKGEVFGFETYHPKSQTDEAPDYTKTFIAVKSDSLGVMADNNGPDDAHPLYAFGKFNSVAPGSDNFCAATFDQPAEQDFSGVTEIDPMTSSPKGMPADVKITYAWKDVKLYVTAAAPGTQFSGDLTYTQNDCSVTYHAVGLWPAVDCGKYDDYTGDAIGTDPDSCLPEADTAAGRPVGSGINPDFPVECTIVREKGLNQRVQDVVCKDNKGTLAVTTGDGACPEDTFCADAAGMEVMAGADGKCPTGSTETPVYTLICDSTDMAKPGVVEPVDGECPKGSEARLADAYEDGNDEDLARASVPITADGKLVGNLPDGVRPVLSNIYPGLALCLLKGEPPQFKGSASNQ